jgi:hypothetical protein
MRAPSSATAVIQKDAIVAEDMAKFPELNLAESLQRLPGVQINREGGEGRRISLRGLGPDFARVQLNGMEVLGNVDSAQDSRGQTSRDRAFDFNIFASELFSKVEVRRPSRRSRTKAAWPARSACSPASRSTTRPDQGRAVAQGRHQPIHQGHPAARRRVVQPELGQQVRRPGLGRLLQAPDHGAGPQHLQLRPARCGQRWSTWSPKAWTSPS